MKFKREFISPLGREEAIEWADRLLRGMGYRRMIQSLQVVYERSQSGAALVVFHPRSLHAVLSLWPAAVPEGTRITVDLDVPTYGQPKSRLDKALFEGELDDLQAYLMRGEEPEIDREYQDRQAGLWNIAAGFVLGAAVLAFLLSLRMERGMTPLAWATLGLSALTYLVYALAPIRPSNRPRRLPNGQPLQQ